MKSLYVSKFALTSGVLESVCPFHVVEDGDEMWLGDLEAWVRVGRNAFLTKEEALSAAEGMRIAKIASLKKQLAKLEAMSFTGKKGRVK